MPWKLGSFVLVILVLAIRPADACAPVVEVQFFESGGGDIFTIANKSQSPLRLESLTIRLQGSRGRLVFDTEDGGPGYSMPQQFEAVDNDVGLVGEPVVADGAEELRLQFKAFTAGRRFMFVIDLDDRLATSDFGQAVVSGAEIEGAEAIAVLREVGGGIATARGVFHADGRALLLGGLCV